MTGFQGGASSKLDIATEHAVRTFLRRLEGRFPVREGIVFGSRARQEHHAGSDADLAVVLRGEAGDRKAAARDMAGIAFDVMLETGILVDAVPLWTAEIERPDEGGASALVRSIKRDGVRVSEQSHVRMMFPKSLGVALTQEHPPRHSGAAERSPESRHADNSRTCTVGGSGFRARLRRPGMTRWLILRRLDRRSKNKSEQSRFFRERFSTVRLPCLRAQGRDEALLYNEG